MPNPYEVVPLRNDEYISIREVEIPITYLLEEDIVWHEIFESLRYIDNEKLLLHCLGKKREKEIHDALVMEAIDLEIPIVYLAKVLLQIGERFQRMKCILLKSRNELHDHEYELLRNSRLTREMVESWYIYIYLSPLILKVFEEA